MKDDEKKRILSRRDFFKSGISKTIPFLVCTSIPSFITSCGDDTPFGEDFLCNECSNSCIESSQSSTCSECSNNCSSSCQNSSSNNGGNNSGVSTASGVIDGYEYVDLGLSVKWARYNIGASKPDSYGSYLYSNTLCTDNDCYEKFLNAGFWKNNKSTSGTNFDMAMSKWGKKWRMPTRDDFKELINNCNIVYTKYNNSNGHLFTSKINGNSIFFAAAGEKYYLSGWKEGNNGVMGVYWTGDIYISATRMDSYVYQFSYKKETGKISTNEYAWDMFETKLTIRPVSNSGGTPSGCNGACTAACSNNAEGGCSGCSSSCSNSCKNTCNYICSTSCSNNCYGRCSSSCGGNCTYLSASSSCSGCASSCYNQCYTSCNHACYGACMSQCINSSK